MAETQLHNSLLALQNITLGLARETFWLCIGALSGSLPYVAFGSIADALNPPPRPDQSHMMTLWFAFVTLPVGALLSGGVALGCQIRGVDTHTRIRVCTYVNLAFAAICSLPCTIPIAIYIWESIFPPGRKKTN